MRNPANKQLNKHTNKNFGQTEVRTLDPHFSAQCSHRLSYRAVLIWLLVSDYYYSPNSPNFSQIRPVVHEKQLSGSQIRISIRITRNFELALPMIITYVLTKFHQNPTRSFWEILLTNKQTNRQKILATQRLELSTLAVLAQFSHRLSYRAVLIW